MPDTYLHYYLAYAAAFGIYGAYALSLYTRRVREKR
jgi:hypothetical protein